MFLLLMMSAALAEPCPEVAKLTDGAWASFNDAELDRAKEILARAHASLSCQARVVPTEQLVRLYQVDALVSLSNDDRKGAVYATIRSVTAAPQSAPGDDLGPELQEMHASWAERLSEGKHTVRLTGTGKAWVDGREVLAGSPLVVLAGEHLVQIDTQGVFSSAVREIADALVLDTGGAAEPADPVVAVVGGEPSGDGPTEIGPTFPPERSPRDGRRHRAGLIIGSAVVAAAGGGSIGLGYLREQSFLERPFTPASINGCHQDEACYADLRRQLILADAQNVRLLYGVGYGLVGAGALLLGTELFILPEPSGGGHVGFRTRW